MIAVLAANHSAAGVPRRAAVAAIHSISP